MSITKRHETLNRVHESELHQGNHKPRRTVKFQRPEDSKSKITVRINTLTMGKVVWEAMGSPEVITVTVESGDTT